MSGHLTLPEWYVAAERESGQTGPRGWWLGRPGPVRRALGGFAAAIARELAEPPAADSRLGAIEPRAKTIALLGLTVGATLLHQPLTLAALLAITCVLAIASGVGVRRLARLWLGIPLFGLAIILPATLNVITAGEPVVVLRRFADGARLGPWELPEVLSITGPGLLVAGRFVLRSTACVTLVYLLVATTRTAHLIAAVRRLGMPVAFGMVLAMCHRYLLLLIRVAEELHVAKLSRTIARGSPARERRWVAAGAGILFIKTYRLARQVHAAMISRGYDGDIQVGPARRWAASEATVVLVAAFLLAILLIGDRWLQGVQSG